MESQEDREVGEEAQEVRILYARLLFFLARICQKRGWLVGQWFQNKGILVLAGMKRRP